MRHDQADFFDKQDPYLKEKNDRRIIRITEFLRATWAEMTSTSALKSPSVLDVGCANGSMLSQLPDGVYKAGIDVSEVLLAMAKSKGVDAYCVDVDTQRLPFPDQTFDLVTATDVIEHVLHTDHLINEINRVLKPGGVFLAGIPNINQPISLVMQFVLDLTPMFAARYRCPHYRDFTARMFKSILATHGFEVMRCEGSYIFPFENSSFSVWMAKRIPRWGAQVLVRARKVEARTIEEGFNENMPSLLKWFGSAKAG